MKPATLAVRKILQESTEVRALPKCRVEFEHNRYSKIKEVDAEKKLLVNVSPANNVNDNEWNSVFDANSITLPNRPGTGIAKARLISPIKLPSGIKDRPMPFRVYAASSEDVYRYWSHTSRSGSTPVATNDYSLPDPVKLTIMYESKLIANKVVAGFETTYASPKSYNIQITEVANPAENQWRTIGSNIIPDSKGQVTLWLKNDGSNGWDTTPNYTSMGWVHGVRLVVNSLTKGREHLDVIQLGARFERDISDLVIDYSKEFEISDRSFIAPLGAASANQASITLSNFDQTFDGDREFLDTARTIINPFYGLIDKKAKFTMDLSIDARPTGSADERLREFTMWVDSWGGEDEDTVSVSLKDSSIFLQEVDMPKTFWKKMTVGAIIWQIMDTVGLTNYSYTHDPADTGQEIPYFWSNQGTAWEQIAELTEATQTAVYFDEYDVMQIRTRKSIFNGGRAVDWNLDAVQNGPKLPEVISASTDDSLVVNHVDINYKPAEFKTNKGIDQMETVWEPKDETVTLRAAGLLRDLPASGGDIYITSAQATHWPYESYVNVRGEIIKYSGKEYLRYKKGGGTELVKVNSLEEKQAIDEDVDKTDPNLAWANNFTGRLYVTERGVSNSGIVTHKLRQTDYSASIVTRLDGTFLESRSNWHHQKDGFMQLSIPPGSPNETIYVMRPNATVPTNNTTYGMRFRFASNQIRSDQFAVGGLQFASDWGDVGAYVEVMTSKTATEAHGNLTGEINLWIGGAGNTPLRRAVPTSDLGVLGASANIVYDRWYDLEIKYQHQFDGSSNIIIYLDGMYMKAYNLQPGQRWNEGGAFGAYARGACTIDVDYLYGVWDDPSGPAGTVTPDGSTWLDLAKGSYTSGYIEREWRFGAYKETGVAPLGEGGRRITQVGNRGFYYYDEFGPVVHEMRTFDIEFEEDDVPVNHSFLYVSNTAVHCTDYTSNPFGATFTLVNASRQDAIIKGEDSITFGIDNKIDQKMFIYGHKLFQEEENIITKTNDQSIRAKGKVSLSFDNQFIQTEAMATELGDWVVDLWGLGADEVSAEIFGNPLLQLGDLITMNYPQKGMLPTTHKFYIVSLKNSFSDGLTTNLILRRVK